MVRNTPGEMGRSSTSRRLPSGQPGGCSGIVQLQSKPNGTSYSIYGKSSARRSDQPMSNCIHRNVSGFSTQTPKVDSFSFAYSLRMWRRKRQILRALVVARREGYGGNVCVEPISAGRACLLSGRSFSPYDAVTVVHSRKSTGMEGNA